MKLRGEFVIGARHSHLYTPNGPNLDCWTSVALEQRAIHITVLHLAEITNAAVLRIQYQAGMPWFLKAQVFVAVHFRLRSRVW